MASTVSQAVTALVGRRLVALRYGAVSAINVINHQVLLNLAYHWFDWSGGWSNFFAAVVAAGPAYWLSRHWVWGVRGSHSLRAEIIPFWTLALLGLVVSTAMAEGADRMFGSGLAVALASLIGYTIVWALKFVVLDWLFARSAQRLAEGDDDARPVVTR